MNKERQGNVHMEYEVQAQQRRGLSEEELLD